jgi:3-oxoacyl-[acyl-carrier protein] reductase
VSYSDFSIDPHPPEFGYSFPMLARLQGKTALVTGGSRGIGRAICMVFAREGANVIVNFTTNREKAETVVSEIIAGGGRAAAFQADVSSKPSVESMVDGAVKQVGPIDILVNNAGILRSGTTLKLSEEDFDRMLAVNLKGIIYAVQSIAPSMIERRYGKIVNLSSLAGLGTAVAETTPYAITKAAVISLTKRLAFELGPHGINVNAIAPGFVRTEMLRFLDNEEDRARLETLGKKAILNRVGTPEDIANTALFLASDESSYMTAQILTVDGGRMDFLTHSG